MPQTADSCPHERPLRQSGGRVRTGPAPRCRPSGTVPGIGRPAGLGPIPASPRLGPVADLTVLLRLAALLPPSHSVLALRLATQ